MAYCRIDVLEDGEEDLLKTLYLSAVAYLAGADISEPEADTPRRAQYDLCVNALVLDAYDKRGTTVSRPRSRCPNRAHEKSRPGGGRGGGAIIRDRRGARDIRRTGRDHQTRKQRTHRDQPGPVKTDPDLSRENEKPHVPDRVPHSLSGGGPQT